jgi:hypothetical protein
MPSGARGESVNDGGIDWDLPMQEAPEDPRDGEFFLPSSETRTGVVSTAEMIRGWIDQGVITEEQAAEHYAEFMDESCQVTIDREEN